MTSKTDQIEILRLMWDEGRISDEEYAELTGGLHAVDASHDQVDERSETSESLAEPETVVDSANQPSDPNSPPAFRKDVSVNLLGTLFVASMLFLVVGALGMASWWVSISAIAVLLTTLIEGWAKVTLIGAGTVAAILLVDLAVAAEPEPQTTVPIQNVVPVEEPLAPIPGSLGVYMDEIAELWNTVDSAPQILRGLTRYNEAGEYDTFIYRFGEWGRLAGGFDPDNDAVYALLATGQFSGAGTDQLYLHLCFVVAPFSQECIDAYTEEGLGGGSVDDFTDVHHTAVWALGEHTWRLETDRNVLTIRVFGADAA